MVRKFEITCTIKNQDGTIFRYRGYLDGVPVEKTKADAIKLIWNDKVPASVTFHPSRHSTQLITAKVVVREPYSANPYLATIPDGVLENNLTNLECS